jgi:hypothetical protein
MRRTTLLLSLIIGFAAQSARCQSNVWEKTIGGNRRLVVSRVALSDDALLKYLAKFKSEHKTLEDKTLEVLLPTQGYTYRLDLYEMGKDQVKCLWQKDYLQYAPTVLGNYTGPLETQILDVCYNESNHTVVLLTKYITLTRVEVYRSAPDNVELTNEADDNTLTDDQPFGPWHTKAGTIECPSQKGWLVRLVNQTNHVVFFAWKDGKWRRQPESEP